jgi:hypothetical protein
VRPVLAINDEKAVTFAEEWAEHRLRPSSHNRDPRQEGSIRLRGRFEHDPTTAQQGVLVGRLMVAGAVDFKLDQTFVAQARRRRSTVDEGSCRPGPQIAAVPVLGGGSLVAARC